MCNHKKINLYTFQQWLSERNQNQQQKQKKKNLGSPESILQASGMKSILTESWEASWA